MTGANAVAVETTATRRGPVEYARIGAGPVVLLIHGTPGSWRQLVPLAHDLADRHTVLLPSRPGYGRTPVGSGRTPGQQAALYAALLDELALTGPVGVVGVSGGGPSAVAFAHHQPEHTSSLALLCALAPHLMPIPRSLRVVATMPTLAEPFGHLARRRRRAVLANPVQLDAQIARDLTPDERKRLEAEPSMRDDLVRFLKSHADAPPGLRGLANDAQQIHAARGRPQATEAVAAPTLVLHGDADKVVPLAHAEHHAAVIPHAVLEVFADAGHIFLVTRRPETVQAVRAHLLKQ